MPPADDLYDGPTQVSFAVDFRDASSRMQPRVLVIDDVESNHIAVEAALASLDIEIVRAYSAKQALRLLLREKFHLALVDIQLPDTNGIELVHLIRLRPKLRGLAIIFVSAVVTDDATVLHGYEAGALDFFIKPFIPAILRARVASIVDSEKA